MGGKVSRLCLSFSCLEWGCPSRLSRTTEKLASLHCGFSACLSLLPSPADQMLHSLAVSLATTTNLLTASLLETSWKGKRRADDNICMQHSCNSTFFNQAQLSAGPFRKLPWNGLPSVSSLLPIPLLQLGKQWTGVYTQPQTRRPQHGRSAHCPKGNDYNFTVMSSMG